MKEFQTLQAQNSTTFSIPQAFLERRMPITDLWDYHGTHSASHPLFVYVDDTDAAAVAEKKTITWGEGVKAMHRAGRKVQDFVGGRRGVVIGILAVKDQPTFFALITGTIRSGNTPFLISSRNSAVAVAHLLRSTGCHYLLISGDAAMKSLVDEAVRELKAKEETEGAFELKIGEVLEFDELYAKEGEDIRLPRLEVAFEDKGLISHSSGSTSFPKPRTLTHKNLIQWVLQCFYGELDWCGKIVGVHSLPMFHILGFLSGILRPTGSGSIDAIFPPITPPRVASPESLIEALKKLMCNVVFTVPSFLQSWAMTMEAGEDDGSMEKALRELEGLHFAGGPLQKDSGDRLVKRGIPVGVVFGATEYGSANKQKLGTYGEDWEYMKLASDNGFIMESQGEGSGLYEMLVKDSDYVTPSVVDRTVDGVKVYSTNDLFVKHPTKEGMWKIHGRTDDQIMHSTGEKTNPGPLEAIINGHPFIRAAIMFGRAQFQAGVLIDPIDEKKFDPEDLTQLAKFRNEIWEIIERANAFAPKHSRIYKEMIIVSKPSKPCEYTAKGTPRRQVVINAYDEEIKAAYAAVEDSSVQGVEPPASWDKDGATNFVKSVIQKVLPYEVGDDDDLFQVGADSLHATSIRNSILRAFRKAHIDSTRLSQNLVYAHPTIASLGKFVAQIASGDSQGTSETAAAERIADMNAYVREFSKDLPVHAGTEAGKEGEVILITGSTGSLGSLMLGQLLQLPSVKRVYAFNRSSRKGAKSLKERQAKMLEEQGLDVGLANSEKLVLIEGDTSTKDLGIDKELYNIIRESVTTIIHNAWRVDFNIGLSSFRPLIQGVRNLIDFALASPLKEPPKILFTSSIAGTSNWGQSTPVPEKVNPDPKYALGNGYGESKWVSERVLQIAREKTPLKTLVIRVGQLAGSRINGNWNTAEWFPAIIQSSKPLGCLPDGSGVVSWVPIDIAASAVVELRHATISVANLINPTPVPWSTLLKHYASSLNVPLVPYSQWYVKLEKAVNEAFSSGNAEAITENPAYKLVEFYGNIKDLENNNLEAFMSNRFETNEVERLTKSLGKDSHTQLGSADVERSLAYWKKIGAVNF